MRKVTVAPVLALTLALAMLASPAAAQFVIGGHDETSESMVVWQLANPSPGAGGIGPAHPHLLLSEIVVTPTGGEYIEICNPTGAPVDLTNYYVSDDWYTGAPPSCYCNVVAPGYGVAVNSDFTARFPAGSIIPAGGVITIASSGADFQLAYGFLPDFELNATSGAPDMLILSNNLPLSLALLTNGSEMVMLFYWDGVSDNVCDVDYVQWGSLASGNGVDKSNIAIDGPDADAVATPFFPDTPPAAQAFAPAPPAGSSLARLECAETLETQPGNGCIPGGPTPTLVPTWGRLKAIYR